MAITSVPESPPLPGAARAAPTCGAACRWGAESLIRRQIRWRTCREMCCRIGAGDRSGTRRGPPGGRRTGCCSKRPRRGRISTSAG